MKIILLGPPGSGKGTQAELLSHKLNIPHISSGNILRQEIDSGSALGQRVSQIVARGDLVANEIIIEIILKIMQAPACAAGFILDGVPRSLPQAAAFSEHNIKAEHIIELACADAEIIQRITNRRVHQGSGRVYNLLSNPPKVAGKDDETGDDLVQREDDQEATVQNRLHTYREIILPVHKYYQELAACDPNCNYHLVDSPGTPQEVFSKILALLKLSPNLATQQEEA